MNLANLTEMTNERNDSPAQEGISAPAEAACDWENIYEGDGSFTGNSWFEKVRYLGGEAWLLWLHDDPAYALSELVDNGPEERSSIGLAEWVIDMDQTDDNPDYPRVNALLEIAESVGARQCSGALRAFLSRQHEDQQEAEPVMPDHVKPETSVRVTAMWGNDDAESTIHVSRRCWQQILDGGFYETDAWSWYEGSRTRASWCFDGGKLTISLDDGMECYFRASQLYVDEVTSKPTSSL